MKRFLLLVAIAIACGLHPGAAHAATGSISASPQYVLVPIGGLGSTVLSWATSGTPNAEVWVSVDDAPEAGLLGRSPSGTANAPWIQAGLAYRYTLYANTEHTIVLSSTLVLGVPTGGGAVGATPTSVDAPTGGTGTTAISWATNGQATAQVWVSMDGTAEGLFAQAPSGTQGASWIQPGHGYQFRLYAGTAHSQLLDTIRVWGDPAYKVGVDYHSTGADFSATAFITQYHLPGVRSTVQGQLQGMADRGASLLHTRLWMVTGPNGADFGEAWRAHFPLSMQEATNLRTYAQDVAATQASDGHRLRLDITLLWLGDADYQMGSPATGLGGSNIPASEFTNRVNQTVASVLGAVSDVTWPDGRKVVDSVLMDGEVMVGAKPNQEWFLTTHYPTFVTSVRNAGLNPSVYFLAVSDEAEVLDNAFVDGPNPVLNGHRSMYWVYRSLKFMRDAGLPLPQRIDFSCYPSRSTSTYATLAQRIFDDADATLPSLGLAKKYGVAETAYYTNNTEREALGDAFAGQRNVNGRLERLLFWTTPDSGGPGINAGYPFEIEDYLP